MAGLLAIPTFVAGAKDDVAAVDIYKQNTSTVITNIQDVKPEDNLISATALRGGNALKDGLKSVVGLAKEAKSFLDTGKSTMALLSKVQSAVNMMKTGSILQRLQAGGSILSGPLGQVLPSLSGPMLSGITDASSIYATVNGISQKIKYTNLKDIGSISNLISNVTGNPAILKITDSAASVGALSGIINTACSKGMPNSFGALMSTVNDIESINRVAGQCVPAVISSCDVGSLLSMGNLTSSSFLKLQNPNILKDFSSNFSLSSGSTYHEISDQYSNLTDAYGSIDTNWNKFTRVVDGQTDNAINLTSIQDASIDLNKVIRQGALEADSFDEKILLLAPEFPSTSVKAELGKLFPALTNELGSSEQGNIATLNPIIMNTINITKPDPIKPITETDSYGTVSVTSYFEATNDSGRMTKEVVMTDVSGKVTIYTTHKQFSDGEESLPEITYGAPKQQQWEIPGTPEYNKRQELYTKTHSTQGRLWKSRAARDEWNKYSGDYVSREILFDDDFDEN